MPPRKRKPDAEEDGSEAEPEKSTKTEVQVDKKKKKKTKYRSQKSGILWKLAGSIPIAILFYGGFVGYRFYGLMYPSFQLEDSQGNAVKTYVNKVAPGQNLFFDIYIGENFDIDLPADYSIPFKYEWGHDAFTETFTEEIEVPKEMIDESKNILLTAVVFDERGRAVSHAQTKLIRYVKPPKGIPTYRLYNGDVCPVEREPMSDMNKSPRGMHQVKVHLVFDETKYPHPYRKEDYNPIMFVDEIWVTDDQLVKMNHTDINKFNTTVQFDLMSAARWSVQNNMERSIRNSAEVYGGDDDEVLQMRALFSNANTTLLVVTMLVSIFHMVFEFLALKNDVEFWSKTKPEELTKYMSVRSVLGGMIFQIILLTNQWDRPAANLLLTSTSLIAVFVDCWKIGRVMKWTVVWVFGFIPLPFWCQRFGESDDQKHDAQATMWVCLACTLVAFIYGFYSLYWECHQGWYSYIQGTATSLVYALGFAVMTPQLFINYKMKSVAHLPWRRITYRAITALIDNLLFLILNSNTSHTSCFKDDVLFFVYLYQRWIYKDDKTRAFDEDGNPVKDFQENEDNHIKAE